MPKRTIKMLQQVQADAIAKAGGITFHGNWFKAHKFHCDENHWQDFRIALGKGDLETLNCEICTKLALQTGQPETPVEDAPKKKVPASKLDSNTRLEKLKAEEGLAGSSRGRRPRSEEQKPLCFRLPDWLRERRPDVYISQDGNRLRLYCTYCDTVIDAKRESTIFFVLQHESYRQHAEAGCTPLLWRACDCKARSSQNFLESVGTNRHRPSCRPELPGSPLASARTCRARRIRPACSDT